MIKIGGSTLANLKDTFFTSLQSRLHNGEKIVIVHGGGPEINKKLQEKNLPVEMMDGIRVTSQNTLSCVKDALKNTTNANLVKRIKKSNIQAVGLCGSENQLIQCEYLNQEKYGLVGKVKQVDTAVIKSYLANGKVPVIASLGITEDGEEVNINADTVAGEVASALSADSVCFVTDTTGIQIDGKTANELSISEINDGMNDGQIYGGMVPKVEAAMKCLDLNIEEVVITDQTLTGTRVFKEVLTT
ncbi:acetylglutamate kinase [Bacillus sp. NEB1478]|uniref:acetylglutamate kinase n=1 Tax=Bacillus sp. NEB1478 TaxID=3073816 RepID=UPI0028730BBC|nr:acetylglutamate kinase [Bacillus sp. NEB1478]WNB93924.1 acetylglutamate kinase [Bacillus sp. NEB1478]